MAYNPPGVLVSQIFVSASSTVSAPVLPACIIGKANQVEYKLSAGAYTGGSDTYVYPSLRASAIIDTASVVVTLRRADLTEVDITASGTIDGTDVDLAANLENVIQASSSTGAHVAKVFTDVNATFITSGVRPGHFVKISSSKYEISDIVSETEVTLLVTPSESAPHTYTVVENLVGTILLSYTAERTDAGVVGQFLEVSSLDDLKGYFGTTSLGDPASILPYAATQAFSNAGGVIYIYTIDGQAAEATAHAAAMDAISGKRVYHICPLTYTAGVLSTWISHVNARSTAENRGWRRLYISQVIDTATTIGTGTDGATDVTGDQFTSAGSTFIADGVKAGDIVILEDETGDPEFVVQSVDLETQLTLETVATGSLTAQNFTVRRDYTKTQMAENLRSIGVATANQRVTRIVPDQWNTTLNGATVVCPGYIAAAARAGHASSKEIGDPHTLDSIGGFNSLEFSNGYFSETQLNTIAEGGMEVYIQEASGAPIQIRDDLTTDMSAFNKQNPSMVIARDWLSYTFNDTLSPQVAGSNITERFLTALRGAAGAVIDKALRLSSEPFTNITLNKLEKNAAQSGHVTMEVSVEQGEPGKYIDLGLFI